MHRMRGMLACALERKFGSMLRRVRVWGVNIGSPCADTAADKAEGKEALVLRLRAVRQAVHAAVHAAVQQHCRWSRAV